MIERRVGERRNPATQGWWLTSILGRERRIADRRQP